MAKQIELERILERQAKSWEVRRRLAGEGGEAARDALAHLQEGPWVAVSRQQGSGGLHLAQRVAEELGWQVYDREILQAIAAHTHTREAIVSGLEERTTGPFRDYIANFIVPGEPARLEFMKELTQVVWGLAKQGHAVIVGRGANWFLDAKYGLRVRVVAPLEDRARRLAERDEIDAASAQKKIGEHDAQRKSFIQQIFGREIDDPLGYDLVLNTATMDLEVAVQLVVTALRRKLLAA